MSRQYASRSTNATYGNVAYQLGGIYAPELPREKTREVARPQAEPQVQPRVRTRARPKVLVREKQNIALFSIVGYIAVAVVATLVMLSCVQLTVASDQVASLRSELDTLQAEEASLNAKYDLAFDLTAIEQEMTESGTMVQPNSDQMVYLDLTAPDTVVRYQGD